MPQLVSTRCAKLKTLQQDKVQWALTRHRSKTYSPKSSNTNVESDSMNTLAIAKKLIVMLSCQNFVELSLVAQKIRKLYKIVKFSSRACIDYLVQNTSESHMGDMLLLYYQLSLYLKDTLALRLNTLLQKVPIVTLDKALCDLLNRSEDAAKAYIYHLTPEQLEYFYMMDLEGFLNNTIDKEKTKRLHYLLYRYQESWETCLYKILLRDQTRNDTQETKEKIYDKAIEKAKRKHIFEDCHHQETERDLVISHLSTWFFEFNHESKSSIGDFSIRLLQSISEDNTQLNVDLLFEIYCSGCKLLLLEDKDTLRIFDIIDCITKCIVSLLEEGTRLEGLNLLLAFAQITLFYIQTDLTYPTWFENTFIHSKTTQLNKKMYTVFVKRLKEAVPYEISTVLQVHGKALAQTNKDSELVTLIKTRLLEIGVDNSLKRYPNGLKTPLQQRMASSALPIAIQDEVATVIEQYIKKEGTIPTSLLQNYVFRRQWFLATFLPVLFSWKSDRSDLQKAKLNLIQALKEKGKIPEILYQQQMKKEN